MNPAILAVIIELIREGVKSYPQLAEELKAIFSKPEPTPEDWLALRTKVLSQSFESLAPHATLPAEPVNPAHIVDP